MEWSDAVKELRKPLDRQYVKEPPAGKYGQYIEGHHAIREANRIFNFQWSHTVDSLTEASRELIDLGQGGKQWRVCYVCTVTAEFNGIRHAGVAAGQGQAKPNNLGDAIESAAKESETDALKRALVKFGDPFALALYDKKKAHVADTAQIEAEAAEKAKALASAETFTANFEAKIKPLTDTPEAGALIQKCQNSIADLRNGYPDLFKRIEIFDLEQLCFKRCFHPGICCFDR